jgi:transmembrane sensor
MPSHSQTRLNAQISEEAAEWFVEFRTSDIDAAGRQAFDAWVRSSTEHLRAYLEVAAIWNEASGVDARHELDVDALIALAATQGNLVALQSFKSEAARAMPSDAWQPDQYALRTGPMPRKLWSRSKGRAAIAASVVFLTALTGLFAWLYVQSVHTYGTQVGERRSIRLLDGSTIELNSRSRVRIDFSQASRTVQLLEGQALFHVANDPSRPFVVNSEGTSVRAVGTQFDVYKKGSGTIVTVVEGVVSVAKGERVAASGEHTPIAAQSARPPSPPNHRTTDRTLQAAIMLSAGQQLTVSERVAPEPVRVNVAAATAWTQRQLVLDSAPLKEVAEEFNRYSERRLVVEDAGEKELRLSGVFATDPDFLIRYLKERPDITVHETDDEIRIIRHD